MNPRATGILAVVAAVLGAFVWFYEIRGEEGREAALAEEKRLFPGVEADDVEGLSLITTGGESARLARVDGSWALEQPLSFPADTFAVDGIVSGLVRLSVETTLTDPQPPAVYGLDEPGRSLSFTASKQTRTLRVGNASPVGGNSYVAVEGEDAVHTVKTYSVTSFEKSLDDLRDKRVSSFDTTAAESIVVRWPGGGVTVRRAAAEGGDDPPGWALAAPIVGRADGETIDGLLSELSFLRADGFVDAPDEAQLASLDASDLEVEIQGGGGDGAPPLGLRLVFGRSDDGETRLVRSSQPSLYRVSAGRIDALPRDLVAYRYRQLSAFDAQSAVRLELVFQDNESTSVVAVRGDEGWSSESEPVDTAALDALIQTLSVLEADDILADEMGGDERAGLGLDPPRVSLRVFTGDDEGEGGEAVPPIAEIFVGGTATAIAGGVAVQSADSPAVYRLDAVTAADLPTSLAQFRREYLLQPEGDGAEILAPGEPSFPPPDLEQGAPGAP